MHVCAVANQKGGVGKTTTVHNLGMALSRQMKTLLVDLDAQGILPMSKRLPTKSWQETELSRRQYFLCPIHCIFSRRRGILPWPNWPLQRAWDGKTCLKNLCWVSIMTTSCLTVLLRWGC